MVPGLGELVWIVDLNRQSLDRVVPGIAADRLRDMFAAAGWQDAARGRPGRRRTHRHLPVRGVRPGLPGLLTGERRARAPDRGPPAGTDPTDLPEPPVGPPLGLGGLPFETTRMTLEEGSLPALYTDGLAQSRTRDVDAARAALSAVLAGAPEEACDRLLATLAPDRPPDDVALLVARTRALDPGHVATLDLPSAPAAVAGALAFATERLTAWGLDELSFTTELAVSELVTNAIRYGRPPVQLRLILQSTLTCEVFDASSTAPHLRRARTFDEGGRVLLLVAQLTERWGTRHSREGKVIWAEQVLPA